MDGLLFLFFQYVEDSNVKTSKDLGKENVQCFRMLPKNPGWLGYTGDYTTQLYRDYITSLSNVRPLEGSR